MRVVNKESKLLLAGRCSHHTDLMPKQKGERRANVGHAGMIADVGGGSSETRARAGRMRFMEWVVVWGWWTCCWPGSRRGGDLSKGVGTVRTILERK